MSFPDNMVARLIVGLKILEREAPKCGIFGISDFRVHNGQISNPVINTTVSR
jgi:hypothetical protein